MGFLGNVLVSIEMLIISVMGVTNNYIKTIFQHVCRNGVQIT